MTDHRSPFELSKTKLSRIVILDWLLISVGLFLIILAIGQGQGWLEKRPVVSLTTFEAVTEEKNETIFVDIAGAVANPGFYQLSTNSRLNDLIVVCGGVTRWADRDFLEKNLNRARILEDGEKIYIPYYQEKEQNQQIPGNQGGDKININSANHQELMSLPGIGEKYAQAIIDHRQSIGPFKTPEEIKEVKGIGEKIFNNIKDKIEI